MVKSMVIHLYPFHIGYPYGDRPALLATAKKWRCSLVLTVKANCDNPPRGFVKFWQPSKFRCDFHPTGLHDNSTATKKPRSFQLRNCWYPKVWWLGTICPNLVGFLGPFGTYRISIYIPTLWEMLPAESPHRPAEKLSLPVSSASGPTGPGAIGDLRDAGRKPAYMPKAQGGSQTRSPKGVSRTPAQPFAYQTSLTGVPAGTPM